MTEAREQDETMDFEAMHFAGVMMQERFVSARDVDAMGAMWSSSVILDVERARTVFPHTVKCLIRKMGWFTLIELTFIDGSQFRFIHARDGMIDQKDFARARTYLLQHVPGFKILSIRERLLARKAAS